MEILNLKQLRNLENAIESLSSSTNIHLVLKNETYNFKRLNSIMKSTSYLEYSNIGHGCQGTIFASNSKHVLILSNSDYNVNTNMPCLKIKPFLVKKIFDRIPSMLIPRWIFDKTLINIHFIERYNGKPNGEPCFDRVNFYYCNNSEIYKDFEMKDLEVRNIEIANNIDNCNVI